MNTREVTVGVVLASATLSCASLTIGPVRRAAWIGQPLELSVPVQLEMGSGAVVLCAGADIFYADSQQDVGHVQVLQEPTEQADIVRLRVVSAAAVDEPVVTVNLRVGCEQKFTRKVPASNRTRWRSSPSVSKHWSPPRPQCHSKTW